MLQRRLKAFSRDRSGAVALEYVLLVSGIGVVILASIILFGEEMGRYWNSLNDAIAQRPS